MRPMEHSMEHAQKFLLHPLVHWTALLLVEKIREESHASQQFALSSRFLFGQVLRLLDTSCEVWKIIVIP